MLLGIFGTVFLIVRSKSAVVTVKRKKKKSFQTKLLKNRWRDQLKLDQSELAKRSLEIWQHKPRLYDKTLHFHVLLLKAREPGSHTSSCVVQSLMLLFWHQNQNWITNDYYWNCYYSYKLDDQYFTFALFARMTQRSVLWCSDTKTGRCPKLSWY